LSSNIYDITDVNFVRCKHVIRTKVHVLPDNNYFTKSKANVNYTAAKAMNYRD